MAKPARYQIIVTPGVEVWMAAFTLADYPHMETLLGLSGLKDDGRDYMLGAREQASRFSHHFDHAWSRKYDSVIQLYTNYPEEAKWIPILEQALKSG